MTTKAELGCAVAMVLRSTVFVAFALSLHLPVDAFAAEDAKLVDAITGKLQRGQCNLFKGRWIANPAGPAYTNASCKFIYASRDCMTNGRPDTEYRYWRWKPYGCELPPFNGKKFLNSMRNKSWVFIGDSILTNQLASLLCLLSKVRVRHFDLNLSVKPSTQIMHVKLHFGRQGEKVTRDETFKTSRWHFPSHNFTVAAIWTPFLLKASDKVYNISVHLDVLDNVWTSQYNDYDYVVIAGGHWFFKTAVFFENDTTIGCHYCPRTKLPNLPELGSDFLYRKALQLAFRFILSSDHKPTVLFRTWTPDHFEFGKWYSGGVCNRTKPYKEGEFSGDDVDHIMRGVEIEEFEKAVAVGMQNGTRIRLLDVYHLSLLRPDGHPGPYRRFHPDLSKKTQNDCLHWCLPGPVDAWNDIVMKMALSKGDLRYSS